MNIPWSKIEEIRNDTSKLCEILRNPECDDETKRRINFYLRNNWKFNNAKKEP